jgi:hypothetical protein
MPDSSTEFAPLVDYAWWGMDAPPRCRVEPVGMDGEPLPVEPRILPFRGWGVWHEVEWMPFGVRALIMGARVYVDGENPRFVKSEQGGSLVTETDEFRCRFRLVAP